MFQKIIYKKTKEWLNSNECKVKELINYIIKTGEMRDAQLEAVETYLFLKIKGGNKPLWELFSNGFFNSNIDLNEMSIKQSAREKFSSDISARALFEFSLQEDKNNKKIYADLYEYMINNPDKIDYEKAIKNIFYDIEYTDYLLSLPMGAGKTFLMAALIYIDLYFAELEPNNKNFAHNFIVLIPSGLKSSIMDSLRTIEHFNPAWVIPEPSASKLKKIIKFEVLDQQKSAKKSNKIRNPNVQKINFYQPFENLMGLILVVNAEKVILDRVAINPTLELIEKTEDEKEKQANELRNIIGKIPNLAIHIDEVHHAATDDIKLRQVVNHWNKNGTINCVLGYSGTPYLPSAEKVNISDKISLKFSQITNTVYYYPLLKAIKIFLKKPRVERIIGGTPLTIIQKGIEDFYQNYENKIYGNNTVSKIAVYCGNIERLEEEIFPFLIGEMNIPKEDILKYHKGNKKHKISKEDEEEFKLLDTPLSKKRIILLVQIGKEGWDCKSLTGVILSQKGDSPANMVLQTSCRCLRQVDKESNETALVWLNEDNANILDKQLRDEQHTSIAEINKLPPSEQPEFISQVSRLDYLKLPEIEFYQYKIISSEVVLEEEPDTLNKMKEILSDEKTESIVIHQSGDFEKYGDTEVISETGNEEANFNTWLYNISKGSFGNISFKLLETFRDILLEMFERITYKKDKYIFWNERFDKNLIESRTRQAFYCKRDLKVEKEEIPATAKMLILENLKDIIKTDNIFPDEKDMKQIIEMDSKSETVKEKIEKAVKAFEEFKKIHGDQFLGVTPNFNVEFSLAVEKKEKTFHYLPYNFFQSKFELEIFMETLKLKLISDLNLEIYYNGDREVTDFKIMCHKKLKNGWKYIGKYTPDFLIVKRKESEIEKILIVETKGSGFGEQRTFIERKNFVENEFVKFNNEKSGYKKFEYLYISDDKAKEKNIADLSGKIKDFFMNEQGEKNAD